MIKNLTRAFALGSLLSVFQMNLVNASAAPAATEPLASSSASSFVSNEHAAIIHMMSALPASTLKNRVVKPLRTKADSLKAILQQDLALAAQFQQKKDNYWQSSCFSCLTETGKFAGKAAVSVALDVLTQTAQTGEVSLDRRRITEDLATAMISTLQDQQKKK